MYVLLRITHHRIGEIAAVERPTRKGKLSDPDILVYVKRIQIAPWNPSYMEGT
jgi:hypothetical protein